MNYDMGSILRSCRLSKKMTQEEVAYGICTSAALSMIENGTREVSYTKFLMLMERMGEWNPMYDIMLGGKHYAIHELRIKIREKNMHYEYEEAEKLLDEFEKEIVKYPKETTYLQFLRYGRVIVRTGKAGIIDSDAKEELEDCLRMTKPEWDEKILNNTFYTSQELIILNNILIFYAENGERTKAIRMFYELKEYTERQYIGRFERISYYSMFTLNLVKYLGLEGRHRESIQIAKEAIEVLVESGKTLYVPELHYDIAWNLFHLDKDENEIRDEIYMSLFGDIGNYKYNFALMTIDFIKKNIGSLKEDPMILIGEEICHNKMK